MPYVVTLITSPANPVLDGAILARVSSALHLPRAPRWLNPGAAADIAFANDGTDLKSVTRRVLSALGPAPVDAFVQLEAVRRKRLFVADMDSTMIGQECIDELAGFAGLKAHVSAITERAMRGEIAFEPALRERVALLKGMPVSVVEKVIGTRITLTPGGRELVRTMRAHGGYTALVSGGFTLFTGRIAAMIGFDTDMGNTLGIAAGVFDGTVADPILGGDAKLAILMELRASLGLARDAVLAAGDGANDLAMLGEAGLGAAFRAKPAVAEAADACINYADLTALLYAQGYRKEEFAA